MKNTFVALLLLAAVSACKPSAPQGEVTGTPAGGNATIPQAASAPSANDAELARQAQDAVTRMAAQAAQNQPLIAGTDYVAIPGGQPIEPVPGKIEVAEVFGYVCPACNGFQPLVSAWKASLPEDVNFVYVPALFGGPWDNYARAYYAAESMGVLDKTHEQVYRAIHVDESLKGERGMDTPEEIAAFYGHYGVDAKQFADTMQSFAINGKISRALQFAKRWQVNGTPTLVVNGKYLVKGKSREDDLRIANQLIAQERASGAAAPAATTPAAPATSASPTPAEPAPAQ